jgi:hypothetical protein
MDQARQLFLGIKHPELPDDFRTEHFNHEQLATLVKAFEGGNSLSSPTAIGDIAEFFYAFDSIEQVVTNPRVEQMWKDGFEQFIKTVWRMVCRKKGIENQCA